MHIAFWIQDILHFCRFTRHVALFCEYTRHIAFPATHKHLHFFSEHYLLNFEKWLMNSALQKKKRELLQHCAQIYSIWQSISSSQRSIRDICDGTLIEQRLFAENRSRPPGTLRSYISSMILFMDYLIIRGEKALISQCMACKTFLQTLSRGLRKNINKRRVLKQVSDLGKDDQYQAHIYTIIFIPPLIERVLYCNHIVR